MPEAPKATPPPPPVPAEETPAPRQNRGRAPVNTTSRSGKYPRRGGAPAASEKPIEPNPNEAGERYDHNEGRSEYQPLCRGLIMFMIILCQAADRGQGRGRGRGGRGGRGRDDGENHRGRPYDKHSQTGKV